MKTKIMDVVSASCALLKTNPARLQIVASGFVNTAGWSAPELANPRLDANGVLSLDFVANPPTGIVAQVVSPISATLEIADPALVAGTKLVRVWAAGVDHVDCAPLAATPGPAAPPTTIAGLVGRSLRVIHPGDAVTMDYRPDRVNVFVTAQNIITRVGFF